MLFYGRNIFSWCNQPRIAPGHHGPFLQRWAWHPPILVHMCGQDFPFDCLPSPQISSQGGAYTHRTPVHGCAVGTMVRARRRRIRWMGQETSSWYILYTLGWAWGVWFPWPSTGHLGSPPHPQFPPGPDAFKTPSINSMSRGWWQRRLGGFLCELVNNTLFSPIQCTH